MKKLQLIIILVIMTVAMLALSALLIYCNPVIRYRNHPSKQPGTTWRTEDDKIVFTISKEDGHGYGVMQTEDGSVEVVLLIGLPTAPIHVCYASQIAQLPENEPVTPFAEWKIMSYRHNRFEVKVSTEDNKVLVFYKDTDTKNSD